MKHLCRATVIAILAVWPFTLNAQKPPQDASRYLVEYTTTEKCWECSTRTAMFCSSDRPDCNVPSLEVSHFEQFDSAKDALTFVNGGMKRGAQVFGNLSLGESVTAGSGTRTFKRLITFTEVPLEKDVRVIETPQPSRRDERVTYRYGKETGEVREADSTVLGTSGTVSLIGWSVSKSSSLYGCISKTPSGNYESVECPKK